MTLTIEAKQPPLPFRLTLRRHKRVKLSEGQLELFVEKPFDSRALLSSIFDFTTCQRPDGTYYGTGGTCRKGVESELPTVEASRKVSGDKQNELKKARVSAIKSGELSASLPEAYVELLGEGSLTGPQLTATKAETDREYERLKSQMKSGTLDPKEVEAYKLNHMTSGDIMSASMITVGMEYGGNAESLAMFMTMEAVARSRGLDYIPRDVVVAANLSRTGTGSLESFVSTGAVRGLSSNHYKNQTVFARALGDKTAPLPWQAEYKAGVASMEARALPAEKSSLWPYAKAKWAQSSPEINKLVGTREATAVHDKERFARVSSNLLRAVGGNPNLSTVVIAPGKGNQAIGDAVVKDLAARGYPVKEFSYTWSKQYGNIATGRIVDLGKGRFLYDIGGSIDAPPSINEGVRAFQAAKLQMISEQRAGTFKSNAFALSSTPKQVSSPSRSTTAPRPTKAKRVTKPTVASTSVKTPVRTQASQRKIDIKRAIQKAKRDGRDTDVLKLEKALRKLG